MRSDDNGADLYVNAALGGDASNPVLGILGEGTAHYGAPVVDTVDNQTAVRHGHCGDSLANACRNAAFEIELFVLDLAKQAPELVYGHGSGKIAE